jgi:predicted nucleic acid-binding Zn ribbon protein
VAERGGKPEPIGEALAAFLKSSGLSARVDRASILLEWAKIVGPQIAKVTAPRTVTEDGTLFVGVSTHAWMTELQLMEVQLLAKINARDSREPIKKIRWELKR